MASGGNSGSGERGLGAASKATQVIDAAELDAPSDGEAAASSASAVAVPVTNVKVTPMELAATAHAEGAPAGDALVGALVADRYRIVRQIGEGGMGAVYEVEHTTIGKRFAVKLVQRLHAGRKEVSERFMREAKAAGSIESDYVAHVLDVGQDERLGLFMLMELLSGEDLEQVLARERRLDPFAACCLAYQAATGLAKAHRAGVIHRDLKPANVFLARRDDGSVIVKLLDFGIAKLVDEAEQGRRGAGLTRVGAAIGTAQYMAPEQAQGSSSLDHRADVYALGAVLYEMIVGEPLIPLLPSYEQMIVKVLTRTGPPSLAGADGLPPGVEQLVADMLATDAEQRLPSMDAVLGRLSAIYPQAADAKVRIGVSGPGRGSFAEIIPSVATTPHEPTRAPHPEPAPTRTSAGVSHTSDGPAATPRSRTARKIGLGMLALVAVVGGVAGYRALTRQGATPTAHAASGIAVPVVTGTATASSAHATTAPAQSGITVAPAAPSPAAAPSASSAPVASAAPVASSKPAKPAPAGHAAWHPKWHAAAKHPSWMTAAKKHAAARKSSAPATPVQQVGGTGIANKF